jgi:uncharacterized protein (DUF1919 family)
VSNGVTDIKLNSRFVLLYFEHLFIKIIIDNKSVISEALYVDDMLITLWSNEIYPEVKLGDFN